MNKRRPHAIWGVALTAEDSSMLSVHFARERSTPVRSAAAIDMTDRRRRSFSFAHGAVARVRSCSSRNGYMTDSWREIQAWRKVTRKALIAQRRELRRRDKLRCDSAIVTALEELSPRLADRCVGELVQREPNAIRERHPAETELFGGREHCGIYGGMSPGAWLEARGWMQRARITSCSRASARSR